jgi:DNA-binding transcriptional ArsR family regulator
MSEEQPINPPTRAFIRAMSHPVQAKIMVCLAEGEDLTAKQIAARSNTPLRSVRHHLSGLEKGGVVVRTAGEKRRGVHQFYYRLAIPPRLAAEEMKALDPAQRLRVSTEALKNSFSDVSASLAAGVFDRRVDRCLTYLRANVDEQGWAELARLHLQTWEEAERVKAECAERLRSGGAEPIRAASTVMWFELPPLAPDS